jgi:hypothetical protein
MSEAQKAQYLTYREYGMKLNEAARKAGLAITTAKDIWKRAGEIEASHTENNLAPPSIEELVAVNPLLEHVGNSPDMTAIKSTWMPIRISIT